MDRAAIIQAATYITMCTDPYYRPMGVTAARCLDTPGDMLVHAGCDMGGNTSLSESGKSYAGK